MSLGKTGLFVHTMSQSVRQQPVSVTDFKLRSACSRFSCMGVRVFVHTSGVHKLSGQESLTRSDLLKHLDKMEDWEALQERRGHVVHLHSECHSITQTVNVHTKHSCPAGVFVRHTRIWKGCHRSRWHSTTQLHSQACSSFGQSNKIQAKDSIRDPWDQERRAGTASCTSGKQHVKLCLLKANCHWNRPYTGIARKLDLTFCRLQISIYPEDSLNKLAYSWMKLTSSTNEYQNKCFLFSWKYHHFGCARRLAPQNTLPSAWSAFVTADFHFIHLLSAHTPSVLCRGDAERKRRERQRVRQIESDTFFHIALAATASWSG